MINCLVKLLHERTWNINGMNFIMLSVAERRYVWKSNTTMIGHSVKTLKLCILLANGFDGDSRISTPAGELGPGDATNKGFIPG